MNIYEITQSLSQLFDEIEESEGEMSQEIEDALEIAQDELERKAEGYYKAIRQYKSEAEACAAEIKRLQALKKARENRVERLKQAVQAAMQAAGQKKLSYSIGSFSLRKTERCEIIDPESVPKEFQKVKVEPDITSAKKAIKAGGDVPGFKISEYQTLTVK